MKYRPILPLRRVQLPGFVGGVAFGQFENVDWLIEERAVKMTDDLGRGWVFVVYDKEELIPVLCLKMGS